MTTDSTITITLTAEELSDIIKQHIPDIPHLMTFKTVPIFAINDSEQYDAPTIRFEGVMVDESHFEFPPKDM